VNVALQICIYDVIIVLNGSVFERMDARDSVTKDQHLNDTRVRDRRLNRSVYASNILNVSAIRIDLRRIKLSISK